LAENARLRMQRASLIVAHRIGSEEFMLTGKCFSDFVEGQIKHLDASTTRHALSARRIAIAGSAVAGLTGLASGLSGLGSALVVAFVALVGVCAPALVTATNSWSAASKNDQRASLHNSTLVKLEDLHGRQRELHSATGDGDLPRSLQYVDEILKILLIDVEMFRMIHQGTPGDEQRVDEPKTDNHLK